MKEIKGYIFDLDGVIVDTAKYHFVAWSNIARTFDYELTHEDNELLKGVSRVDSLEIILELAGKRLEDDQKKALLIKKNEEYLSLIEGLTKDEMLPGVEDLITEARELGFKIGLGSASKNAEQILVKLGIIDYFETIVDGNGVVNGKPHPEVFLTGAKNLGLHPEECIVFEDSQKGIVAANTGGFGSVGIGNAEELQEADLVISSFEKLTYSVLQTVFIELHNN